MAREGTGEAELHGTPLWSLSPTHFPPKKHQKTLKWGSLEHKTNYLSLI